MTSKKVGFTSKATKRSTSFDLLIPGKTAQSLDLEKGDVVKMKLRNMNNEEVELSRKVQKMGDNYRIYIPVSESKELGLEKNDLIDVFMQKT